MPWKDAQDIVEEKTNQEINKEAEGDNLMKYNYESAANELINNHQNKRVSKQLMCELLGADYAKVERGNNFPHMKISLTKVMREKGYILLGSTKLGLIPTKIEDVEDNPCKAKQDESTKPTEKDIHELKLKVKPPYEGKIKLTDNTSDVNPMPNDLLALQDIKQAIMNDSRKIIEFNRFIRSLGARYEIVITAVELRPVEKND